MTTPATAKQRWILFKLTRKDYREDASLTVEQASRLIEEAINGKQGDEARFTGIWETAYREGLAASRAITPTPMVVVQHRDLLDDSSPVVKQYAPDMGGVCGFAWVNIKPATSKFCRWLKKNDIGRRDSYYGGLTIWISEFGQSYERKLAMASRIAEVIALRLPELRVHATGRLD